MSKLLVSIKNLHEARLAVDAGIDVLDVKEPDNGPLGRADWDTISAIGELRESHREMPQIWSIACGELFDWAAPDSAAIDAAMKAFDLVKIGLAHIANQDNWFDQLQQFWGQLPAHISPVIVAYLDFAICDAPPVDEILLKMSQLSRDGSNPVQYLLFDTFTKGPDLDLFSFTSRQQMSGWIQRLKTMNVTTCVAGSISNENFANVLQLNADFIGVRSVVCHPDRNGSVDRAKLKSFAALHESGVGY